jgi:paired amphipathic helix protein Sin3a
MCYSVLNDDWASHPTWASEDSGFVAHRKNIYEEALHRIEEERHDYDFNIEANQKVIQLLEPIGQQILAMSSAEVANFRMPTNLGGSSPSIHKRILKKIYGPERGAEVAADLFKDPTAVLPTVLARLKQKDEEWRFTQREWDKVWHAQTQAMYLKSLDHMGIHAKTSDKKIFAPKNIVDLIKLKHEEQRRQRSLRGRVPRYQFAYEFKDEGVIVDAVRLAVLYVTNAGHHSGQERERIAQFFERFIPLFFDISIENVQDRVRDISRGSPDDDMEDITPAELTNGRGRRANGKKADLLRGVLDRGRNGTKGRGQKEDSAASGSKESTPDLSTLDDGDEAMEAPEDQNMVEVTNERWLATIPGPGAVEGTKPLDPADMELKADKFFQRDYFNLYCNQTIIVFFTLFEILYRRLKAIKDSEQDVIEEVRRSKYPKPAKDIGLIDDKNDFFSDDFTGDYYSRALFVMEELISGEMDETRYQEFFRRYYLKKGWALYTLQELLKSVCRMAALCSGSDNKDKTPDIIELFADNRDKDETTYNIEINLRKQVEKYVKDGEMFLVKYVSFFLHLSQIPNPLTWHYSIRKPTKQLSS